MSYEPYYSGGWQSGETGGTPVTPEALNHMDEGIKGLDSGKLPAIESADHPGCYYRIVDGVYEWLNPPLEVGAEYRTTERLNSKPVYTKSIDCGYAPNTGVKFIDSGVQLYGVNIIFSVSGYTSAGTPIPYYNDSGQTIDISFVNTSIGGVLLKSNYDATSSYCYAIIKYTKG